MGLPVQPPSGSWSGYCSHTALSLWKRPPCLYLSSRAKKGVQKNEQLWSGLIPTNPKLQIIHGKSETQAKLKSKTMILCLSACLLVCLFAWNQVASLHQQERVRRGGDWNHCPQQHPRYDKSKGWVDGFPEVPSLENIPILPSQKRTTGNMQQNFRAINSPQISTALQQLASNLPCNNKPCEALAGRVCKKEKLRKLGWVLFSGRRSLQNILLPSSILSRVSTSIINYSSRN